jgi:hypothetical protein
MNSLRLHMPKKVTVTLDDEIHQFVSIYAKSREITLGAAIGELIRKAQAFLDGHYSESNVQMSIPAGNKDGQVG